MNLNLNSASARLYRWFYCTDNMPQSLCPYFWKLVIMWVFIVPYTIVSLPAIIKDSRAAFVIEKTMTERFFLGFFFWVIISLGVCMLSCFGLFFFIPDKNSFWFQVMSSGLMCWIVSIIAGGIILLTTLYKKWKNRHIKYDKDGYRIWEEPKEKQPSIIVEFVKASYNKYCPKIDWK